MPLAAYGRLNELIGWLAMTSDSDDPDKAAAPAIAPPRAAFIFLFITVLLDMLALGIIVPR